MKEFKVTFERMQVYYATIIVEAQNIEAAHSKATVLSNAGLVRYDLKKPNFVDDKIFKIG